MLRIFTTVFSLFLFYSASAQIVSTISDGQMTDGIGLDSDGNLYCSNFAGPEVFKVDPSGIVTIFKDVFTNPNGITVNDNDEIFICDHGANKIYKYDQAGVELAVYDTLLNTPTGIHQIPGTSDMLVAEYSTNRLKKLESNGTVTTLINNMGLNGPSGIAFINDTAYLSNFNNRKIFRYDESAGSIIEIAELPSTPGQFNSCGFLSAMDGLLYATHLSANKIYVINPHTGVVSEFAGSVQGADDGDFTQATFNGPNGILCDEANQRMYITDYVPGNLRIIDNISLEVNDIYTTALFTLTQDFQNAQVQLDIDRKVTDSFSVEIVNAVGQVLQSNNYQASQKQVQLSTFNFATGTYFVIVKTKHSASSRTIFIK